ncbi:MAG TPA: hypothetical protein VMT46_00950 [Anaerolineaceae bacterium]|nr:hypothetical protein [Anaerolineaceae bacterium]
MSRYRRLTLTGILLGTIVLLGILFRDFLFENVVRPMALVLWLFWRVLLSVDQKYYWIILIFTALFYAFYLLVQRSIEYEEPQSSPPGAGLEMVSHWRNMILLTGDEMEKPNPLRRELALTLTTLYASRQPGIPPYQILTDLQERCIPLPDPVYTFLFPPDDSKGPNPFLLFFENLVQAPHRWIRRRRRIDVAEYHRSIDAVLAFIETEMEK